jgi:hypothetical protein
MIDISVFPDPPTRRPPNQGWNVLSKIKKQSYSRCVEICESHNDAITKMPFNHTQTDIREACLVVGGLLPALGTAYRGIQSIREALTKNSVPVPTAEYLHKALEAALREVSMEIARLKKIKEWYDKRRAEMASLPRSADSGGGENPLKREDVIEACGYFDKLRGLPPVRPPARPAPVVAVPLAQAHAVVTTAILMESTALQWTAQSPSRPSALEKWIRDWIRQDPPTGDIPTNVNCWDAVLHIFLRAEIIGRTALTSLPPFASTLDLFLALFPVRPAGVQAAAGDVLEFVARRNGANPPGAVGDCQHVALVTGAARGGNIPLIELDSSRGPGWPVQPGRLWAAGSDIVLADLNRQHAALGPWTFEVRRFHSWP